MFSKDRRKYQKKIGKFYFKLSFQLQKNPRFSLSESERIPARWKLELIYPTNSIFSLWKKKIFTQLLSEPIKYPATPESGHRDKISPITDKVIAVLKLLHPHEIILSEKAKEELKRRGKSEIMSE